MKRGFFIFSLLIVFSICLFAWAEDDDFVENPTLRFELSLRAERTQCEAGSKTQGGGHVVGNRKYFVENPAPGGDRIVGEKKYFGRDYIVRNPRATPPPANCCSSGQDGFHPAGVLWLDWGSESKQLDVPTSSASCGGGRRYHTYCLETAVLLKVHSL